MVRIINNIYSFSFYLIITSTSTRLIKYSNTITRLIKYSNTSTRLIKYSSTSIY